MFILPREEDLKSNQPISLLTSSDEDDVIYQEPKYDTVVVSDETDEEDQPLLHLLSKRKQLDQEHVTQIKNDILKKIMKKVYQYFCVICHYSTDRKKKFFKHIVVHEGLEQSCTFCPYKTFSVHDLKRHITRHTKDNRLQCHLCEYSAKHHMSLVYHVQSHKVFSCKICDFKTMDEDKLLLHEKETNHRSDKTCAQCDRQFKTKQGLLRHMKKHERDKKHSESA